MVLSQYNSLSFSLSEWQTVLTTQKRSCPWFGGFCAVKKKKKKCTTIYYLGFFFFFLLIFRFKSVNPVFCFFVNCRSSSNGVNMHILFRFPLSVLPFYQRPQNRPLRCSLFNAFFFFFKSFLPVHAASTSDSCVCWPLVWYSTHCDVCLSYTSSRPSWKRKDSGCRSLESMSTFRWWLAVFFLIQHRHHLFFAYFCTKLPICWFCKYCKMHFDIIDMFLIYTS